MWDVSDVKDDVVEHVKVISTTMKKTVSGPLRTKADNNEGTPLLQVASDDHQNPDYTSSIQVVFLYFLFTNKHTFISYTKMYITYINKSYSTKYTFNTEEKTERRK